MTKENPDILDAYYIGKVKVSVTNIDFCIEKIISNKESAPLYICVGNVRTIVLGNKDEKYRYIVNNSFMNLPDGMPLIWAGKIAGAKAIQRSSGPDLFSELLKEKYNLKHFLLGDTQEVLDRMIVQIHKDYPNTIVAGHYSPPFEPVEKMNISQMAGLIASSNADVIWVALGAPKQDFFSAELVKHCDRGVVIGVGAAFRFLLGEYSHPPRIFQLLGMEGFFWRFFKNPMKEFLWYCKHIPIYLWLLTKLKYNNCPKQMDKNCK